MKAIVYTSNTGFTKAYAEMLGKKINLPVYNIEEAKTVLPKDTQIIYLGWLFASNIKDYKKANKRYKVSCVCGVGLGDTGAQTDSVRKAAKVPNNIPLFTLQGGMYFDKLHGINKFMIKMLVKMLESKDRTDDENKMLELIKKGGNYVDEKHLASVIKWYEENK